MPTYQNNTSDHITVDNITFEPNGLSGDTKQTKKILNDSRLTEISATPYYNPYVADTTITLGASGATNTYNAETTSQYIRVTPITGAGNITFYINNIANTPAITVVETTTIENKGKIDTLIFEALGACSFLVQEIAIGNKTLI